MMKKILSLIATSLFSLSLQAQNVTTSTTIVATPHISAPEGAFAKTVLMPGDPLRAKYVAETFLEDAQLVTSVRNMLGYTGTYKGERVSVMGSGMPSIGIYSWELYSVFGVENIIRIGSAGSYRDWLNVLDVTLAESAVSESTYAFVQNGETRKELFPDATLNEAIKQKATELGTSLKLSKVYSSDVFYSNSETWQETADRTGGDCVEMESFALFHNAAVLGKRAACLLTISDSYVNKSELTSEERENSFNEMIRLALETAISESVTGIAETAKSGDVRESGKYVENGQVVIYKNGKRYNAEGISQP